MEKKFWDENTSNFFYCLKDEKAYLKGTRDNLLTDHDTTYWIYQVLRCNNEFRARTKKENCEPNNQDDCYDYHVNDDGTYVDPECASESAITEWLEDKVLITKMMNP